MARSMRQQLLALQICLLLCGAHAGFAVEKGKLPGSLTRGRDCSPWGLDAPTLEQINPAFKVTDDDPLDTCTGVINHYYFFKVLLFVPQLETSLAMRAVKAFSEVLWNINAHFRDTAIDTLAKLKSSPARRRPLNQRTVRNRNIAIAFGLSRLAAYLVPPAASDAQIILNSLMSNTTIDAKTLSQDFTTPQGIGNLCAAELIASLKKDGWNSEGDLSPENPFPYFDYTNYVAANPIHKVINPSRWQPLIESNQLGYFQAQTPSTMQLRSSNIAMWSVTKSYAAKKASVGGPGWSAAMTGQSLQWMKGNATAVLAASAALTDTQKLLAEFFDAKIMSFGGFERLFAYQNKWCHDQWIEYEQMSACFYDATVIAWKAKARTDAIRPMSAIRWLVEKGQLPNRVNAWAGPGMGTRNIATKSWQSYLRTMPHTEWPSGTSCLCKVFAEWTQLYNKGSDKIDLKLKWKQGCGMTEPGVTPKSDLSLQFTSLKELNRVCSESRKWAGVHFQSSLKGGADVCGGIAAQCLKKVKALKAGKL